jgi:hypothetical protein
MSNAKMLNGTKRRMLKCRMDKTTNAKMSNETKYRMLKCRMGQNVECQNVEWDKMSNRI